MSDPPAADAAARADERRALVRQIQEEARASAGWTARAQLDPRVLDALARVPRHLFVRPDDAAFAYADHARPIDCGQTISQPFVVALMTDLARIGPGDRVLEVGTGSGYQTAVLASLAGQVFSVELHEPLARAARERLARLGFGNVELRVGDGWAGWPEQAPYAAIVVTAAASELPEALVAQLAPGGRLVIPVGPAGAAQDLLLAEKDASGAVHTRSVLPVAFVPLVRGAAGDALPRRA
jgi:protein-L-isoaspartate(D-aspartate) O-methyltransferase